MLSSFFLLQNESWMFFSNTLLRVESLGAGGDATLLMIVTVGLTLPSGH